MKAYLVRVGIDSTHDSGNFNAPVDLDTMKFAYVPIQELGDMIPECRRDFNDYRKPCTELGTALPSRLWNANAHVDPDFSNLTYGDIDGKDSATGKINRRGSPLRELIENDLLVFYAGLKPIQIYKGNYQVVDVIIGLYVVKEVMTASSYVSIYSRDNNAHTRRQFEDKDVIVIAKPELSGRLDRGIIIGGYRESAHRVFEGLLEKWGGLSVNNGWIQRSARLPQFINPDKFYEWFKGQLSETQIRLIRRNN